MRMNKVLVKLYVPLLEEAYDIWLPLNKKISNVIILLVKAVNEFSGGYYNPSKIPFLYDKLTGNAYNINLTIKDANIRNGTEIILI